MAQFSELEIRSYFRGANTERCYYSYNNNLYAGTFPEEWALDHKHDTGPNACDNCRESGCWNGVFLGYCSNCAIHVYAGERGKGFFSPGEEIFNQENENFESAFDTYLYNVNLHDVGDTDFCDSMSIIINRYANEFVHRNPRDILFEFRRMNDVLSGSCTHQEAPVEEFDEVAVNYDGVNRELLEHFAQEPDDIEYCYDCENVKYDCCCHEESRHESVFCYGCEKQKYECVCSEESRNQTHYCLQCEKTKYNCICSDNRHRRYRSQRPFYL